MQHKYIRPRSAAAYWSPRFGWLALAVLAAAIGLHYFGFIRARDLLYFMAALALCAGAALILAGLGLRALWQSGAIGGLAALRGIGLALLALSPLLLAGGARLIFPPLYDISTDFDAPPQFPVNIRPADALPAPAAFSAQAAAESRAAWPDLSGRRYDGSPDMALPAVYAALRAEGWQVGEQQGLPGEDKYVLISAVAKSPIMGFRSDIVIRLTDEGDTSFVDMRAAARYLPCDYGLDARYIEDFMAQLDAEILSLPGDEDGD